MRDSACHRCRTHHACPDDLYLAEGSQRRNDYNSPDGRIVIPSGSADRYVDSRSSFHIAHYRGRRICAADELRPELGGGGADRDRDPGTVIRLNVQIEADRSLTLEPSPKSLVQHLFDKLPLDCGDSATPRVTDNPAVFDTQPFVPGYLVSTIPLEDQQAETFAPSPALDSLDSRAGPPDGPPPKSID